MEDALEVTGSAEALLDGNEGLRTDEQVAELLNGDVKSEVGDTGGDEPTPGSDDDSPKAEEGKSPDGDGTTDEGTDPEQDGTEGGKTAGDEHGNADDDGTQEEPVILAKDGKHTIEYQKLVDAREDAKAAKQELASLQDALAEKDRLIAEFKAGSEPGESDESLQDRMDELAEDLEELAADYPGVADTLKDLMESNKTLAEKVEQLGSTVTDTAAMTEVERHFATIDEAHPDRESVIESTEFEKWLESQPSVIQSAYESVLDRGTAEQVIEVLDAYKATAGETAGKDPGKGDDADPDKPKVDIDKKVADAEKKAAAPESLSDVPGGTAHHDEGEALLEMSSNAALAKLEGKTPAQINALLEKVL